MPSQGISKTQRACKACRTLKVRCLPGQEGEICQKCLRSGAECIFEDQRPRRKRDKPDSRARVAALERKIEEVIAQVSQINKADQSDGSDCNDNDVVNARTDNIQKTWADLASSQRVSHTSGRSNDLPTPKSHTRDSHASCTPGSARGIPHPTGSTFIPYPKDSATPEALISQGQLSIKDVEHYIGIFHGMCAYFPFVLIPSGASVDTLLKERPLLLHAGLAVATSSEVHLQKALEMSFKEIMLSQLMIKAEKSIDLLQSMLICMAWGHFFHIPKRDQAYQLLQLTVALCVDMGLNLKPSAAMQKVGLCLEHFQPSSNVGGEDLWCREARRAFLGCYHVSTMHNWIWRKPNTMECSEHILQCAKSISDAPEHPTDDLILPLIQIQQIGDEYHNALRAGNDDDQAHCLLNRIGTHSHSFQKQLQNIRNSLTATAVTSPAVNLAIHFATVYTHEQDLLSPWTLPRLRTATNSVSARTQTATPITHPSRIDLLLTSLHAATAYLDHFLMLPTTSLPHLATTQYSGMIYSLVITYRLSIGTPRIPFWDVQLARSTVKLERYLAILCERMQRLTRERLRAIADDSARDLYSVMGLILQNVRNTYEKLRYLPQALSSVHVAPVHAVEFPGGVFGGEEELDQSQPQPQPRRGPIFVHEVPRAGYQSRCPAMQFWSVPEGPGDGDANALGTIRS